MALPQVNFTGSNHPEKDISTGFRTPEPVDERKTTAVPRRRPAQRKQLDAGPFEAEVGSFRPHLAAEGKAGRTLPAPASIPSSPRCGPASRSPTVGDSPLVPPGQEQAAVAEDVQAG